jgi:hypothetical protein
VEASVSGAARLYELVTASLPEYEALAREPNLLSSIRRKLEESRFDSDRFCRGLEVAYLAMRDCIDAAILREHSASTSE